MPALIDDALGTMLLETVEIDLAALVSEVELVFSSSAGALEDAVIARMAERGSYLLAGSIFLFLGGVFAIGGTIEDSLKGRHKVRPKRDVKLKCAWSKFKIGNGIVSSKKLWVEESAGYSEFSGWADTMTTTLYDLTRLARTYGPRITEMALFTDPPITNHGKLWNEFQQQLLQMLHTSHKYSLDYPSTKRKRGKAISKRN